MKVLIICVCYNNPEDLLKYLDSIEVSIESCKYQNLNLNFAIVNNGEKFSSDIIIALEKYKTKLNVCLIEDNGNVGYFPGMQIAWSKYSSFSFDFVIASNVDLKVNYDFFDTLHSYYDNESKIIGPKIISEKEKKNRNPKILTRPSTKNMLKYVFLYSIPYLHHFYKIYIYPRKKREEKNSYHLKKIYAPHGSFIIFQNLTKNINDFLCYPIFLFGEEIYVGEVARRMEISVIFNNDLIVIDSDHATTSLQKEGFLRKHNLKAMKYLLSTYW